MSLTDKLDQLLEQLAEYDQQLIDPEILSNPKKMTSISQKRSAILGVCEDYQQYKSLLTEIEDQEMMLAEESDPELRAMIEAELPEMKTQTEALMEKIKGDLVTSDDRAIASVILELRAGVGGDEAGIWVGDLYEMYQRYASTQGWKLEVLNFNTAEMGGYKLLIANLQGEAVWQHFGYEGGTHCVKRVPATESQGRIHTSTATVAVLPEPEEVEVDLNMDDVKIDITTSQGPGGQNVNKVETAVKLLHIPTGIEVRMQDAKSQHQNKEKAFRLLRARLHEHAQQEADKERRESRSQMIGSGERGERIRTYRYKDNLCVDHRLGESFNLKDILAGNLTPLVNGLIEHDKTQRLAAL